MITVGVILATTAFMTRVPRTLHLGPQDCSRSPAAARPRLRPPRPGGREAATCHGGLAGRPAVALRSQLPPALAAGRQRRSGGQSLSNCVLLVAWLSDPSQGPTRDVRPAGQTRTGHTLRSASPSPAGNVRAAFSEPVKILARAKIAQGPAVAHRGA